MTGTLAQIIALTAYGNAYIKDGYIPTDFNSANTILQFCNRVYFVVNNHLFFFFKPSEKVIANNPTDWFKYLKMGGCKHLRLYFENSKNQNNLKDHITAGLVGGGGTWLIEAIYNNYSNYWTNTWEVTNQKAADRKIWSVKYKMAIKNQHIYNLQIDVEKVKEKLRNTLSEIADFAFKQNLQSWGEQFDKAKETLSSPLPNNSYFHKDLIPFDNYSLTAKQLLFSAASAWVFGGMGSWNDLGFHNKEDNDLYNRLSEQLYSNINEAIISATNSY